MGQRLIINESERNNIRGLYENHGSTKIEHHLDNMVDQMSDEQIQQLQQELDTMGITSHTGVKQAMSIVKQEEAIQSDMDEAMKKQKAAEILSSIGTGLIGSTLVPLIPLAIGNAMNIGFAGGLAVHFATAGLLIALAKVIRKKQGSTEHGNR
jgi:hypothetical protein